MNHPDQLFIGKLWNGVKEVHFNTLAGAERRQAAYCFDCFKAEYEELLDTIRILKPQTLFKKEVCMVCLEEF